MSIEALHSRSCRSFPFPRTRGDALIFCRISQIRRVGRNRHTADERDVTGKARLLRIRTQWARADSGPGTRETSYMAIHGGSEIQACRIYRPRSGAVFNPVDEQIEYSGRRSTEAVAHVGDRIKARELRPQAAEPLRHFFIVRDEISADSHIFPEREPSCRRQLRYCRRPRTAPGRPTRRGLHSARRFPVMVTKLSAQDAPAGTVTLPLITLTVRAPPIGREQLISARATGGPNSSKAVANRIAKRRRVSGASWHSPP